MIKLVAYISMFLDHFGYVFFPDIIIFSIMGRFAFPLFAWGIAKGYKYTRNITNYSLRLFLLGIVSQIPYYFLFSSLNNFNICFTLMAGLIAIWVFDNVKPGYRIVLIVIILIAAHLLNLSYGIYGVLTILTFHVYYKNDYLPIIYAVLTLVSIIVFKMDPIQLIASLAPILLLFINDKDFRINRIFQYAFYPAHMIVLIVFKYLLL